MMTSQRTGDVEEFETKFKTFGDTLLKLCMVYLGSPEDAEEAMQEAFMKLLYRSPSFESVEHEKRWLIRITINICKDKFRSFWRKNVIPMKELKQKFQDSSDFQIAENILSLPTKYKSVIHLYYYEDYKIDQISEILHISISAVKMRLKRGRELLKIELGGVII